MEDPRNVLYRQFEGGILVYDIKARHPCQTVSSFKLVKNSISPTIAKNIEKSDQYGIFIYR